MRSQFQDILKIDGVRGVMYFTPSGQQVFEEFPLGRSAAANASDWFALAVCLGKASEGELVFEKGRLYIRRSKEGVLLVVMGLIAPTGMVRLASDILLSGLRDQKPARGIRRFFKR
jgi:hypothetical protein